MTTTVHCVFHHYSDYECSTETLIGIYFSQGDAETALLELVARGERLTAENRAFEDRFRECHAKHDYGSTMGQIVEEQRAWHMKEFGQEWSDIPDTNVDNYTIEELEIGKLRG